MSAESSTVTSSPATSSSSIRAGQPPESITEVDSFALERGRESAFIDNGDFEGRVTLYDGGRNH